MSTNQKDRRENSFFAPCTKQLAVLQLFRVEKAAANTARIQLAFLELMRAAV